jgi:hypothetical protein
MRHLQSPDGFGEAESSSVLRRPAWPVGVTGEKPPLLDIESSYGAGRY